MSPMELKKFRAYMREKKRESRERGKNTRTYPQSAEYKREWARKQKGKDYE
jgi:hypothetical protein